jgi:hypothetical protein
MFKKTTLLALAAVAVSAFAQTNTTTTTTQSTTTTVDSGTYPWAMNMDESSFWGQRHEVWNGTDVLNGGDKYYFGSFLDRLPSNQEMAIVHGLYNVRARAMALRHDQALARMNSEWPIFAQAWDTTTWVSKSSTTDAGGTVVTQTTTTTATTPTVVSTTSSSELASWNTSGDEFRPLRYAYEMKRPRSIDYRSAMVILGSGLNENEQGLIVSAFQDAPERDKDIIVRLITRNLDQVDTLPLRVTYIDSFRTSSGYSNP